MRRADVRRRATACVLAMLLFAVMPFEGKSQGTRRTTFYDSDRTDLDRNAPRRPDPRDLERRNNLYNDLKRDFGKPTDDFGSMPVRRSRVAPVAITESREILDSARRLFDSFAREAEGLQVALNNDVDYIRGVRGILPDVIQFSANMQVVKDRCMREARVASLARDFEAIDLKWQAISYNLRQIPEIARTQAKKRVELMDDLNRQLSEIFKVKPHFDQRELFQQTAYLSRELQNLGQDINLELVDPEARRQLHGRARRAQSQVQMMSDAIDSGNDQASIVGEFKQFQSLWSPLAQDIRRVDTTRTLERTVLRVNQANRDIGELLRMAPQNDTSNLGYMMETLKRDIDEYFTRAPLKLLMELPDSRTALVTAGEFYGSCEQFRQDATGNASQTDLGESFRLVADSWHNFERTFRPMNSEPARRVLNRIEDGVNSITDALQLYDQQFDRRRAIELTYNLISAAESIHRDTRSWVERDQVEFGRDAIRETKAFIDNCQQFSDAVNRNIPVEQLRRGIVDLYENYRRVYGYISQCRSRERLRLGENASRTKSALVDLRTLLEI